MKKILSVLLALVLLFGALTAVSEGFDFKSYSDDELLALIKAAQQEAVTRKLSLSADLMAGSYIAGEDIPAGKYTFLCRYTGDWWANMTVYTDRGEGRQKQWEMITSEEAEAGILITLEEGDQLECDEPFTLTVYGGIFFK